MGYISSTIDSIKKKNILIISFTGSTPHLETSLEAAQRLAIQNKVSYIHLGKYVSRPTLFKSNFLKRKFQLSSRVKRAKKYLEKYCLQSENLQWINSKEIGEEMSNKFNKINKQSLIINIETLEQLKSLKYNNYDIGLGIASTLISDLKDPNPFPLSTRDQNECKELFVSGVKALIFAELLLSKKHYDTVVLLNGRFSCENMIKRYAISNNIATYFHECGPPFSIDSFFFEKYMPHNWDERKKEMLKIQEHMTTSEVSKIGSEFFRRKTSGDGVYEKSYVKDQLKDLSKTLDSKIKACKNENRKIISYYTTNDDEYQFINSNSNRYPIWQSQISAIKEISKISKSKNYYLIVRVHPNLKEKSQSEQKKWEKLGEYLTSKGDYWIDQFNPEPTYSLLDKSDIIISAGSTVGCEAIYLSKPSIVIAKCFYDGIIPSVKLCNTPLELISHLDSIPNTNNIKSSESFIYGAWAMNYAPKFKYFLHRTYGEGIMKDGTRIASPGMTQKIISTVKKVFHGYS